MSHNLNLESTHSESGNRGSTSTTVAVTLFQASVDKSSKSNIREKLIRFFLRRPTMDDLFKKGIIRNEPVFGSTLRELEANSDSNSPVPNFVTKCIAEIEKGDLLQTDGVYRQSGNLSTVQKIRLQVRYMLFLSDYIISISEDGWKITS